MKQFSSMLLILLLTAAGTNAQTKVFRDAANAVRSDFNQITQGRQVIGYVNLVQIEKSDKDSFNYELAILDENLNDISTAKFRDIDLDLTGVAFDSDVLCLSFFKNTTRTTAFRSTTKFYSMLYFMDLTGKILNKVDLGKTSQSFRQLTDLPNRGFAGVLGNTIYAYDLAGKEIWSKEMDHPVYNLSATSKVLAAYNYKDDEFFIVNSADGKQQYTLPFSKYKSYGASITGVDVINDTVYYTGTYLKRKNIFNNNVYPSFKNLKNNAQKGAFVARVWAPSKTGTKVTEAMWSEGDISDITSRTGNPDNSKENYLFSGSVTDSKGDSYFYAYTVKHKPRIGNIVGTVVLAPLIMPPFLFAAAGYNKYYFENAAAFRMTPKGTFTRQMELTSDRSEKFGGKQLMFVPYTSYSLNDKEGANPFFIASTKNDIKVINLKTRRTKEVPKKQGDITSTIYPAKEGHFLLVERNKAAKTTSLSIVPM